MASRIAANLAGPVLLWTTRREERRVAAGLTYEPPTILERRNWIPAADRGLTRRSVSLAKALAETPAVASQL
jgi:hypothetical protein